MNWRFEKSLGGSIGCGLRRSVTTNPANAARPATPETQTAAMSGWLPPAEIRA